MTHGIYIMANDRVIDNTIALLNSIRLYDRKTPIVMIPYDKNCRKISEMVTQNFDVHIYEDLEFLERLSKNLSDVFGRKFFARPNQFRKQACWFGLFDEFLYLDTDIIVFEKIIDSLRALSTYDFVCCDYQNKRGINNIFTENVLPKGIFKKNELQKIFNAGFWGSKKNLISEKVLHDTFKECADNLQYFDFSTKVSDMPILNYLVLKKIHRKINLAQKPKKGPGSWAGMKHFQRKGNILIDPTVNKPLKYLHWAGIRIEPGCPYWDIWKYYRTLNPDLPFENEKGFSK